MQYKKSLMSRCRQTGTVACFSIYILAAPTVGTAYAESINIGQGTYFALIKTDQYVAAAIDSRKALKLEKSNRGAANETFTDTHCKINILGSSAFALDSGMSEAYGTDGQEIFTAASAATEAYKAERSGPIADVARSFASRAKAAFQSIFGIGGVVMEADRELTDEVFAGAAPTGELQVVIGRVEIKNRQLVSSWGELRGNEIAHSNKHSKIFDELISQSSDRAKELAARLGNQLKVASNADVAARQVSTIVQAVIDWSGDPAIGGEVAAIILDRTSGLRWYKRPSFCPEK